MIMDDVLVVKSDESILISYNGKRLVIDKNNKLFKIIKDKTKEEIAKWYKERW